MIDAENTGWPKQALDSNTTHAMGKKANLQRLELYRRTAEEQLGAINTFLNNQATEFRGR